MHQEINSLILEAKNIGIVSHDSGGANIINSLAKFFKDIRFNLYARGPAKSIFNAKNIDFIDDENIFFNKVDFIIFGTGSTSFEKKYLKFAKSKNIKTAAILDHFVNFRQRFTDGSSILYPDYCFVCDEYSLDIAYKELAPFKNIGLCKNYLIESMCQEIKSFSKKRTNSVLYVLENIQEEWDDKLQPWEIAFNNFYNNFYKKNNFDSIIVRPHPKDSPSLYKSLKKFDEVIFDLYSSPINSLSKVSVVVGVESYLLYLAYYCGFDVYTSIPNNFRSPNIPEHVFKRF